MIIRKADDDDLPAILAIHNDAVLNSTAVWDDVPVDLPNRAAWLEAKRVAGQSALACESEGVLIGYASFGVFRPWSGYNRAVEHSVYVASDHRRKGAARLLMSSLMAAASERGVHVMVAGIEAGNLSSIALHEALGFEAAGTLREVGKKFGRFLDLTFMCRTLNPRDRSGAAAAAPQSA